MFFKKNTNILYLLGGLLLFWMMFSLYEFFSPHILKGSAVYIDIPNSDKYKKLEALDRGLTLEEYIYMEKEEIRVCEETLVELERIRNRKRKNPMDCRAKYSTPLGRGEVTHGISRTIENH